MSSRSRGWLLAVGGVLLFSAGCQDKAADARLRDVEDRLGRLEKALKKTERPLNQLEMRSDACIAAISKLAKALKMDLGFWVPTPALPADAPEEP